MPSSAAFKNLKVFDSDYAYLDSGAPASPNYTTWVILHGMGFNGAVFEKILPLAHAHNLRIVSVNRRGYAPSSGFKADELEGIGFGKTYNEAEPFFRGQGVEIATFLAQFVIQEDIPLADPNGLTGGIVLIGWSLASIHVLAVLAYLDALSEDTCSTLHKYLHTILSHGGNDFTLKLEALKFERRRLMTRVTCRLSDASTVSLGIPNIEQQDTGLWLEPDDRKRLDTFFELVTAHYVQKSVTSENVDDINFNTPSDTMPRSMHELSYEERANYTDLSAFGYTGCDGKLLFCDVSAFAVLTKRALFDKALAEKLPKVRLRYMNSGTSPGALIWPLWMLRKHAANPKELYGDDAEQAKDIKYICQTEGNHFIFWDDPEKAIQQYSVAINL